MSTLIKNAQIVTMSPDYGTMKGSILIENGKIEKIFPYETSESLSDVHATEVIDADWNIVMPGMTNAHYHSYSNLLKGTENDLPLEIWSLYTVAYGHSLLDEDIYLSVLLGAAEMIRSGVTGCLDHFPHLPRSEAALKAYDESGMHVSFAPMMHDVPDHQFLNIPLPHYITKELAAKGGWSTQQMRVFYEHLIESWHQKNGKIHITLGPNAPQRCSEQMLILCKQLSEQYDLDVHTHLLETKIQEKVGRKTFENGIIGFLDKTGLLNDRLSVAHAVWLSDDEIDLLKERNIAVVHNPASNMTLGSGKAPVIDYLRQQIPVGLGTDASNCGTSHNLFEMMRLAAMMPRLHQLNYEEWPQAEDIFEMATVKSAKVMDARSTRGRISEGYVADLVLLKTNTTTWASTQDVISQLVFHENGQSVDSVMIQGKWVLRNKEICTFDEKKVIARVQARMEHLKQHSSKPLAFAEKLKPYFEKFYWDFYNEEENTL